MSLEKYSKATQETADNLRIIDDAFFRLIAEKIDVCQEMLRTLLDNPHLSVLNVEAQSSVKSLHREIILDAKCLLEDGSIYNIEMQKGKSNDDISRTRFHASALTATYTPKGADFSDVPDVTVVYITEYDALKNGRAVTHSTRCIECGDGSYVPVNDGEDIIYANTCVDDGTDKSELLKLMLKKESFYNERFPAISNAIKYFKETEGGREEMCKAVEDYAMKYAVDYTEARVVNMISAYLLKGGSEEEAVSLFQASEVEIAKAKELLLQPV